MRSVHAMRSAGVLLVAALTAGACTGGGAPGSSPGLPQPTSSPAVPATPTPSPSPTPADASAAFAEALNDPLFTSRITVTGEMTFDGISMPIQGVIELRPGASHSVLTVAGGASAQTTEAMYIGSRKYERIDGVWFDAGTPEADGLGDTIRGLGGFRDTGVETRNGTVLHHMELPPGVTVPPEAFDLDDPGMSHAVVHLEAWAEASGTPALMVVTASWSQASGDRTIAATMTMELAFTMVSVDLATPANVWKWQESATFAYKAAYPADWEYEAGATTEEADWFVGYDGSWVAVWREETGGDGLNSITTWVNRNLAEFSGLTKPTLDSSKADTLAGATARRLSYHGTRDGESVWETTIIAVKGAYVYFVDYGTLHEPTKADLELFTTFVARFSMI